MKVSLIAIGLLLAVGSVHAGAKIPDLFTQKQFNARILAEAANHYISLGERGAIKELKALEKDRGEESERGFRINSRIAWICRIIFLGPGNRPLREPLYGALLLPDLSMPLERWPLYPLVKSDEVFFVLSDGYMLAGTAERPSEYIDYCSANGSFRDTKVKIPTKAEAVAAFATLKNSDRWKAIKWKDGGPGNNYTMSEEWTLSEIEPQATSIAEN